MILFTLLACWGQRTVGCPDLDAASCADDPTCATIDGFALAWNEELACYDVGESEAVGCMAADVGCDDAITYAGPGDGTCFEFPDSCTPEGWTPCDPSPSDEGLCASS